MNKKFIIVDGRGGYPELKNILPKENYIKICVKFISEQFKDNDENTVVKKQDSWTFEKLISSKDPKWLLSST